MSGISDQAPIKKASIVSIGNEVLNGRTVDTNAAYIARRLRAISVPVVSIHVAPDEVGAIRHVLDLAAGDADVVVISGGLGPTDDDLTRQAIADFLGVELALHEDLLAGIRRFFDKRGVTMPARNAIQAHIPAGAKAIDYVGAGTIEMLLDEDGSYIDIADDKRKPGFKRENHEPFWLVPKTVDVNPKWLDTYKSFSDNHLETKVPMLRQMFIDLANNTLQDYNRNTYSPTQGKKGGELYTQFMKPVDEKVVIDPTTPLSTVDDAIQGWLAAGNVWFKRDSAHSSEDYAFGMADVGDKIASQLATKAVARWREYQRDRKSVSEGARVLRVRDGSE